MNPIAGMGGRVGLKGTDGPAILKKARELGATSISPARTIEALRRIACMKDELELVVSPCEMGEDEATECGFKPRIVGSAQRSRTTAADTVKAAEAMLDLKVDLLLFSGGDGTARDICRVIGLRLPVLGIPTGVKMHSAVFAVNPMRAGDLAVKFLQGEATTKEAEVMDVDEDAFREGRVSARLYGYLLVAYERNFVQPVKSGSPVTSDERLSQESIAKYVIENMEDDCYYILGPGTTVKAIADKLGVEKTLLGVDVVHRGKIIAMDLDEAHLLQLATNKKLKIIITPIGSQGFIFGRGNQQISPKVIKYVGRDSIIVVATASKLHSIGPGAPLIADTGDREADRLLSGYMRVITGYRQEAMVKVEV